MSKITLTEQDIYISSLLMIIIVLEAVVLGSCDMQGAKFRPELMVYKNIYIAVETTSDWTEVFFYGVRMLNYSYEVVEGAHAPELSMSIAQNIVKI